ncbi:uncharacterized protein DDB_G0271670-like [Drosophila willistoni]|uniref:uncharacterized protein DDB_G0271670-like n=1 Tax=Drosophila willistoni TaxID=7260 RepID=UPI001F078882|nr:uncharacterized protein DDB_G0271670-like [Drosophila willistoni]
MGGTADPATSKRSTTSSTLTNNTSSSIVANSSSSTTMPKKPQHLSLANNSSSSSNTLASGKPKYSLTLHNNKYAANKNATATATTTRDNHQQRQHLKALRLTNRDVVMGTAELANSDYKRPTLTTGLSPTDEVSIHLNRNTSTMGQVSKSSAIANGEASTNIRGISGNLTKLNGNGLANGMTTTNNSVISTQNNRLWYH